RQKFGSVYEKRAPVRVRDRAKDAFVPRARDWCEDDLEKGQFIRVDFAHRANEPDERIAPTRNERNHEFLSQPEFDRRHVGLFYLAPCLREKADNWREGDIRKKRL